jgi:hypothetical protein
VVGGSGEGSAWTPDMWGSRQSETLMRGGVRHSGHRISNQRSWSNEPSEPLSEHLGQRIKDERSGSGATGSLSALVGLGRRCSRSWRCCRRRRDRPGFLGALGWSGSQRGLGGLDEHYGEVRVTETGLRQADSGGGDLGRTIGHSSKPKLPTVRWNMCIRRSGEGHIPRYRTRGGLARREGTLDGRTTRNHGGGELRPVQGRG